MKCDIIVRSIYIVCLFPEKNMGFIIVQAIFFFEAAVVLSKKCFIYDLIMPTRPQVITNHHLDILNKNTFIFSTSD